MTLTMEGSLHGPKPFDMRAFKEKLERYEDHHDRLLPLEAMKNQAKISWEAPGGLDGICILN